MLNVARTTQVITGVNKELKSLRQLLNNTIQTRHDMAQLGYLEKIKTN
jgi:hypothetical protein